MDYDTLLNCTDEELCAMGAQGVRAAEEVMVARYRTFVRACARPLFLTGGDSEDLTQEGMVGLLMAIREYDPQKAATFRTFAEICIRNRLYSALRADGREKHALLNQSVSLDNPFFDSNSYTFGARSGVSHVDPADLIAGRDYVDRVLEKTRQQLSEFEAKILGYYLEGLSCGEIAATVGKSPKSVDNAVQRVRRKVARQIESCAVSES